MSKVVQHFLDYVAIDTQSVEDAEPVPSTEGQLKLAFFLKQELEELGLSDVSVDEHGYVMATLPANCETNGPVLGFVAHMDTAPACSGTGIKPQIWHDYPGGPLKLHPSGITLDPKEYPALNDYIGQDLITSDGTTLLGADDKAGIAEIVAMAEYFLEHPQIPHGTIRICFTPDEEVGRGADFFQVETFGADVAYTVDGGSLGELEYENFNAASAKIVVNGLSIHPGSAKGAMKNSTLIAMELQSMLPVFENPMYTELYEGFYHLDSIAGNVEQTVMSYIIRDHDMALFEKKKERMEQIAAFLNQKYGENTVQLTLKDSYYNMKEKIKPHFYLIDIAKETMEELGITPKITPIRGGTDGARLSYMGLPCPNLCTGGHNFHGRYEFISIQSMEKIVELLVGIAGKIR